MFGVAVGKEIMFVKLREPEISRDVRSGINVRSRSAGQLRGQILSQMGSVQRGRSKLRYSDAQKSQFHT